MIHGKNFFDQPIKGCIYENIQKIAIGQGDDYTTGCLLDYNSFIKHYKMMAIDTKAHSKVWDNFLEIQRPLKMIKNGFYFTSKAPFVLKIFKCFGHVTKRLH